MKKFILLLSIIALFCQSTFAQTGGLNFQGIARNASGAVLANQKVNLKFSILKTTETGAVEYTETKEVTTNAQGIFAVVVGEVNATSFAAVDWKASPKFLKVEMDPAGGTSFVAMGTTRLQNVPYAYYANGVNANNIDGSISVAKGGTGATDAAAARTNLGLVIGTNVQAPLTAGTDYLTPTGNAATATKLAAAKKINGVDFDGSADISITATADASTLSGTVAVAKGGTGATDAAAARTNLGLVIGTNVQAPLTAGTDYLTPTGSAASLTGFPTLNQNTTGNAATATKLSTARNINGVAFDGSADITVAADASTLSGTVAIAKGGTGATTAAAARTNLGLVIGTNVQAPLTAGTDYLTPTGSAASLTNFPTLNQNTTGNAASATKLSTARNINGVAFDGSANITVAADASTLSGTVSIAKGGTGLTTVGTTGQVLSTTGSGTLTWTTLAGLPTSGNTAGEMLYWNGSAWVKVAAGSNGQTLSFYNGAPVWLGANTVVSPTGRIWMDRNLGASQVATSSTDAASFGDLYQWGRGSDGHQIRTSSTTATLSSSDQPGVSNFITTTYNGDADWRNPKNGNLWQGVSGVNNPCPTGFRIPTETEWEAERLSWSTNSSAGALASPLKLPMAGNRVYLNGALNAIGLWGQYWSSTVYGDRATVLFISSGFTAMDADLRAQGSSVRCIKD